MCIIVHFHSSNVFATGKTYYYNTFLADPNKFVHINQDTLNTKVRCLAQTAKALDSGKSVVVDNTNPDKITRRQYIEVAKTRNIPARCIYFTVPEKICKHNNAYREFHQNQKKRVPSVAYATFYNRLDSPRLTEGFKEIYKIEWAPQFVDDVDKKAWEMFYF